MYLNKIFFLNIVFGLFPIALLFSNVISEIFLFIIIFIYIYEIKNKNYIIKGIFKDKIFVYLLFFFAYLILNYLVNYNENPSLKRTIGFLRFPLFVLAISYFININYINLKKIFRYWICTIILIYFDLFFQKINGFNLLGYKAVFEGNIMRLGGFMNTELKISHLINHFSVMVIGYYFLLSATKENKKYFFFNFLLIFFTLFSVFITAERSNFITIFITLLTLAFFQIKIRYFFGFFVILVTTYLIFAVQFKSIPLVDRMIFNVEKNYDTIFKSEEKIFFKKDNNYFPHYAVAYEIFKKNPFFGSGMNNFNKECNKNAIIYKNFVHPNHVNRMCSTHPHSFYFELLSELGLLGLFMLLVIFVIFFYRCFISYSVEKKNYLLLSGSLILLYYFLPIPRGSFFTNWTAIIFWLTFGVVHSQLLSINKKI